MHVLVYGPDIFIVFIDNNTSDSGVTSRWQRPQLR